MLSSLGPCSSLPATWRLPRAGALLFLLAPLAAASEPATTSGSEATGTASPAEMPNEMPDERYDELERKIDILAQEIERLSHGEVAPQVGESYGGLGPAASKVFGAAGGLSIGGYGEFLYQNFRSSGKADSADALRAILYFGYKFSDRWVLNTEIEIEHADEVFLEFATLDYLWRDALKFRVGLLLIPMGFINELHEPTTFLSARRPDVESFILPSTWRENGVGIWGECEETGLEYRAYFVNGFNGEGFKASNGLRGGRQKGSKALASDWAGVARLDYTGVDGLLVGSSYYFGHSGQESAASVNGKTRIFEAHAEWKRGGFHSRALYTQANVNDSAALATASGLAAPDAIGEELEGGYVEFGYDVLARCSSDQSLTPFIRWEGYDLQKNVPAPFVESGSRDVRVTTVGLAWAPFTNVIFKADFQNYNSAAHDGINQFNLAMGYIF